MPRFRSALVQELVQVVVLVQVAGMDWVLEFHLQE